MKKFRRLGAMAMIALMIASAALLPSCGARPLSKIIEGLWVAEVDVAPAISESIESELGVPIEVPEIMVKLNLEFYDDGTYSMSVDAEEFSETLDDIKDKLIEATGGGLYEYAIEYVFQMIESEIDGIAYETGSYEVYEDGSDQGVELYSDSGSDEYLSRSGSKSLELYDTDMTITFVKKK